MFEPGRPPGASIIREDISDGEDAVSRNEGKTTAGIQTGGTTKIVDSYTGDDDNPYIVFLSLPPCTVGT